jgi:hypothetical protein
VPLVMKHVLYGFHCFVFVHLIIDWLIEL